MTAASRRACGSKTPAVPHTALDTQARYPASRRNGPY
jgi:hypothetical protein